MYQGPQRFQPFELSRRVLESIARAEKYAASMRIPGIRESKHFQAILSYRTLLPYSLAKIALRNPHYWLKSSRAPYASAAQKSTMKRSKPATDASTVTVSKRRRVEVPEYCSVDCAQDETGAEVWPAPDEEMQMARDMIIEW